MLKFSWYLLELVYVRNEASENLVDEWPLLPLAIAVVKRFEHLFETGIEKDDLSDYRQQAYSRYGCGAILRIEVKVQAHLPLQLQSVIGGSCECTSFSRSCTIDCHEKSRPPFPGTI